jgi:putative transposase
VWLDARYEKVREGEVVLSRTVLVAMGWIGEGRQQVLAGGRIGQPTGRAPPVGKTSWSGSKPAALQGVSLVFSDDHPGLRRAVIEVLPEAL